MLRDGQSAQDGKKIADDLMTKLEIDSKDLLSGAYMDMLLASDTCDGQPPSNTHSWCIIVSYVNKDLTFKDKDQTPKDKDKDQTFKAKDKDKD